MNVGFLVNGGYKMGLGHLSRCLSLANYFSTKNIHSVFFISDSDLIENITSQNHLYEKIDFKDESILKYLKDNLIDVLIIDSKSNEMIKNLDSIKSFSKLVVIDNLVLGTYADLLILPGMKEQFHNIPKNSLCGENFVLLNPKLNFLKNNESKDSIFLSMGGSDQNNITKLWVQSFLKLNSDFKLKIVLGPFYKHEKILRALINDDSRFQIFKNPPQIYDLMNSCKLGLVTFGITVYEAAKVQLPLLVISHNLENDLSAKGLEKYGWYEYLGKFDSINFDDVSNTAISLSQNPKKLKRMSESGKIIDGFGTNRVGDAIIQLMNK